MNSEIKNLKLVMYEAIEMPEKAYNKTTKEWEKTGAMEKRYRYTFRDAVDNTLVLFGDETIKEFEGKQVDIFITLEQREFQGNRTTRVKLDSVVLA